MSEYRHTISKASLTGYAQDPSQITSNGGTIGLDKELTVKGGLTIAVGATYGKKVLTSAMNTMVDQIGSDKLSDSMNLAKRGVGYGFLLLATPQLVPFVLAADAATFAIDSAVTRQGIRFENERIQKTRGVLRSSAGGNYA